MSCPIVSASAIAAALQISLAKSQRRENLAVLRD